LAISYTIFPVKLVWDNFVQVFNKDKGPISRADISKITKLTRSTISTIVEYLIKEDLIKEIGLNKSRLGRRVILLELNSNAYYS